MLVKLAGLCFIVSQNFAHLVNINNYPNCQLSKNFVTVHFLKNVFCGLNLDSLSVCCSNRGAKRVIRKNPELVDHENFEVVPWDVCGVISNRLRITSGRTTSPGEFPWMALIAYKTGNSSLQDFKCGGTLINEKYILTAAHCIDNTSVVGVRLGGYDMESDCSAINKACTSPVQDLPISEVIIHPFYDSTNFFNDIALIKLAKTANYTNNVKPICLPFDELLYTNLEDREMTVTGWGRTEDGKMSQTLRKVLVPIVPTSKCQKLYEKLKNITKKQLCAGGEGRDSCAGDSGGPLKRIDFIDNSLRYVQYGIVSFGPSQCGLSARPGIYTNLQKYMTWILDNLKM